MKNLFISKCDDRKMNRIEDLYNRGEFLLALQEITHYLDLYPKDLKALYLRGKMLRLLKRTEEAREVFLMLFPFLLQSKEYQIKVLVELVYLEMQVKDYLSAYSYLERLERVLCFGETKGLNISLAKSYLRYQLGMAHEEAESNYFMEQVFHYDEARSKKRFLNQNFSASKKGENSRLFSPDIDLEELYSVIQNVLPIATVTPTYNVFDTYIFEYPGVGYDEEGILNHVQVLAYSDVGGGVFLLEISPYRAKKYKCFVNDIVDLESQKECQIGMTALSRRKSK